MKKLKTASDVLADATFALVTAACILTIIGCESSQQREAVTTKYLDSTVNDFHGLGWLGARSHPLSESLLITDPDDSDKTATPGGIVLAEVDDDSPLAGAGLLPGDAIVRVADDWIPIKEDPTLDLIAMIEDQISANKKQISVGYLRTGKYAVGTLQPDLVSIDDGLPLATKRSIDSSFSTLKYLATMQQADGAFASQSNDEDSKLIVTSIAGLAFLSADTSIQTKFVSCVDKCLEFVAKELDSNEQLNIGALTAAYVSIFLAESDVQLMDENWLERIGKLTSLFDETQDESGGWNVADKPDLAQQDSTGEEEAGSTPEIVDVLGAFTTNQVLLAFGALERKGLSGENEAIEKACRFLNRQSQARIPSPIDRRIKAALSAGTAAALVALNCDRNDLDLRQYLKDGLERAHDMYSSPSLGLPGLLHTSIAARQTGNETWIQFHNATKYLIMSLQNRDGSISIYPDVTREPLQFELTVESKAWQTAHVALVQSVQSQSIRKLLALDQAPMIIARDSSGKKMDVDSAGTGSPGMQMIQLDGANAADAEELKKMIMEKMKEQGLDVDESKIKMKKSSKSSDDDD